jgi:hypothetical protein
VRATAGPNHGSCHILGIMLPMAVLKHATKLLPGTCIGSSYRPQCACCCRACIAEVRLGTANVHTSHPPQPAPNTALNAHALQPPCSHAHTCSGMHTPAVACTHLQSCTNARCRVPVAAGQAECTPTWGLCARVQALGIPWPPAPHTCHDVVCSTPRLLLLAVYPHRAAAAAHGPRCRPLPLSCLLPPSWQVALCFAWMTGFDSLQALWLPCTAASVRCDSGLRSCLSGSMTILVPALACRKHASYTKEPEPVVGPLSDNQRDCAL